MLSDSPVLSAGLLSLSHLSSLLHIHTALITMVGQFANIPGPHWPFIKATVFNFFHSL